MKYYILTLLYLAIFLQSHFFLLPMARRIRGTGLEKIVGFFLVYCLSTASLLGFIIGVWGLWYGIAELPS